MTKGTHKHPAGEVVKWRLTDLLRLPGLAVFGTLAFILCFIFNRTTVSGKHNLPHGTNVIIACRHQSLIDSFPVSLATMRLLDLFRPWILPWHTADRSNYMGNWLAKIWGWFMKILPISPTRVDPVNLRRMVTVTKHSRLFVFPGGTRERPGRPLKPRVGIGHVAVETGATIVPVWISGMDKVLPVGKSWPNFGQRVRIIFGPPVNYQDLLDELDENGSRATKRAVVQRVAEAIYSLSEDPASNPEIAAA